MSEIFMNVFNDNTKKSIQKPASSLYNLSAKHVIK